MAYIEHDDGRVGIVCYAGCATEAIVQALGCRLADVYPPDSRNGYGSRDQHLNGTGRPHKPDPGPTSRVRPYTAIDIAGRSWSHARQEDVDGRRIESRWQAGTPTADLLPHGSEGLPPDGTVYVVEGESTADALRSHGVLAVATFGTGYKPNRAALAPLTGRHVVLWPDADIDPKKGRAHMLDMAHRLDGVAKAIKWIEPPADKFDGWDAADATRDEVLELLARAGPVPHRSGVRLTPASSIKVRPVRWLWQGRLALGTLALLAGREGIGKTTVGYTKAADVTQGNLPGVYFGQPKSVIVAATEDAWAETIVPRLMAAGADLDRIFRVDVVDANGIESELTLPGDLVDLERRIGEVDAAMILLDPLISRLDGTLDTHKDAEVRLALEPIVAIAIRTRTTVLGLIHVNKSGSVDPLTTIMASRAFASVPRAILYMMTDPEDDKVRLLGQPKNNLGPTDDLPTLTLRIESAHVADTEEGPVTTARVVWLGASSISIRDALSNRDEVASRTKTARLGDAMRSIVRANGGEMLASAGYAALEPEWSDDLTSEDLKTRARKHAGIRTENREGAWWWVLREDHAPAPTGESSNTGVSVGGHPPDPPDTPDPGGSPVGGLAESRPRRPCPSCHHDHPAGTTCLQCTSCIAEGRSMTAISMTPTT